MPISEKLVRWTKIIINTTIFFTHPRAHIVKLSRILGIRRTALALQVERVGKHFLRDHSINDLECDASYRMARRRFCFLRRIRFHQYIKEDNGGNQSHRVR